MSTRPDDDAQEESIVVTTDHGKLAPPPELTFDGAWDAALAGVLSKNSKKTYRAMLVRFARFLLRQSREPVPRQQEAAMKAAARHLPNVTSHHITQFREEMRSEGLSPATINLALAAVASMYRQMMRVGLIHRNPASNEMVARMRVSNVSRTEGLEKEEAEHLLRTCANDATLQGARDLALIAVLMHNGLRRSEPIKMDADKFRMIRGTPTYTMKVKGDKTLTIEIIPIVWQVIDRWLVAADIKTGPVFRPFNKGRGGDVKIIEKRLTAQGVYDIISRRVREAGIKKRIHPHSLRHTYATLALLNGVPIQEVQISMGHSSTETTFRYYRAIEQVGRSPGRSLNLDWSPDPSDSKEE